MELPSLEFVAETALLVLQTLTCFSSLWAFGLTCFAPLPPDNDNNDPQELNNLLAPPSYVRRVSLSVLQCLIYSVLMDPEATSGRFVERYSTGGTNERVFLTLAEFVAGVFAGLWVIFEVQNWRYLSIMALCFMWCGSLPLYLVLNRKLPFDRQVTMFNSIRDAIIECNGKMSVRLYFTWLTGALIFRLLDVAQYFHGSIFSYRVYFQVMVMMLTLAFVAYGRTRDPLVAFVAMWFLCQVINREDSFEGDGDAKETFEKLLEVAKVVMPVFPLVMVFNNVLDGIAEARTRTRDVRIVAFSIAEERTRYGSV